MNIFPAVDIYGGNVVRLYKGNYDEMTVYGDSPLAVAREFESAGAKFIHMVDLEGAKTGGVPNLAHVRKVAQKTSLFVEIGGGIRTMEVLDRYFSRGVFRAILGTAAVNDEQFLKEAIAKYGDKIAVGADIKDGFVAIKGWVEKSEYTMRDFFSKMQSLGVSTIICTDISKDGAMRGTNLEMYKALSEEYSLNIVASGGVSTLSDVLELAKMNIYGAIIGKAYYTGAINLSCAIRLVKNDN